MKRNHSNGQPVPNLVQKPTGPVVYQPVTLPPVQNVPLTRDPGLPSRVKQG